MNPSNPEPHRPSAGGMPDAGTSTAKQKIKERVRDAEREVSTQAREKADAGKHRLAGGADALSDAVDAAASSLDDHDREGLARYARDLSSKLADAAGRIEGRSVDELANDAKRLARNNPALFMLGSMAVGFGLSRFFKASAQRDHDNHDEHDTASRADASANIGSAGAPLQRRAPDAAQTYATPTAPRSGNGRQTR